MLALVATSLFTNEGALAVTDRARLTLGGDGATETLTNTGDVYVGSDGVATGMRGDLAIRGKYTVNGAGSIQLLGDGSRIVSDGVAASTLFNQSEIFAVADRQIGDAGGYPSANGLGLANSGSVVVLGQQNTLTLNTGSNRIDDGGGLLEAAAGVCATKAACGKISAAPTPQLEQNAFFSEQSHTSRICWLSMEIDATENSRAWNACARTFRCARWRRQLANRPTSGDGWRTASPIRRQIGLRRRRCAR